MFNREDLLFRDYCITNKILTEDRWKQFVDTATNYGMNDGFSNALIKFNFFLPEELVQHIGKAFNLPVMKLYAETSSERFFPSVSLENTASSRCFCSGMN
jgi:hypothetical protein